jgi:hypothetical protein
VGVITSPAIEPANWGAHELPDCLLSKVSLERAELRAHASWFHTRPESLPPYMVIKAIHAEHEGGYFSGYTLLFNLDTAQLIALTKVTGKTNEQQYETIDAASVCPGGTARGAK